MPQIPSGTQIGPDGKRYPAGSSELEQARPSTGTVINVDTLQIDNAPVVDAIAGLQRSLAAISVDVRKGNTFMAGSGRLVLTRAGYVRATVANPAGSGRMCVITQVTGYLATGPAFASVILNPTTGLPSAQERLAVNTVLGGPPGVGVVSADVDEDVPLGGGTESGIAFGLPEGGRFEIALPNLRIPPGVTLGLNLPMTQATEMSMAMYWWEEPT